jgi:hypothetical protein
MFKKTNIRNTFQRCEIKEGKNAKIEPSEFISWIALIVEGNCMLAET